MADYGIIEGRFVITDIAESKLLKKITSEENLTAIIFWLKHNHASYIPKFSVEVKSDNDNSHQLSHDQIKQVSKAMIRMGLGEALVPEQKQLGEEAIEEEKAGRKPEY